MSYREENMPKRRKHGVSRIRATRDGKRLLKLLDANPKLRLIPGGRRT